MNGAPELRRVAVSKSTLRNWADRIDECVKAAANRKGEDEFERNKGVTPLEYLVGLANIIRDTARTTL